MRPQLQLAILLVLLYEGIAYSLSRALIRRFPWTRIWLMLFSMVVLVAAVVAGVWLPRQVPDRSTPVLMVAYLGIYLLAVALALLGLPYFVAAVQPLRRKPPADAAKVGR